MAGLGGCLYSACHRRCGHIDYLPVSLINTNGMGGVRTTERWDWWGGERSGSEANAENTMRKLVFDDNGQSMSLSDVNVMMLSL